MMEYVARFLIGGLAVSASALLGDMLRPKGFAGLFGVAPSVALATLATALWQHGASYAAVQGKAMMWGALALLAHSIVVCHLLMRWRWNALPAITALLACLCVAFDVYFAAGGSA